MILFQVSLTNNFVSFEQLGPSSFDEMVYYEWSYGSNSVEARKKNVLYREDFICRDKERTSIDMNFLFLQALQLVHFLDFMY